MPDTLRGQVEQASRWFFGPGRALRYLRDPATRRGPQAVVQAVSALGSAAEWLGCAVVPPLTLAAAWLTTWPVRALPRAVIALYVAQLLLTETRLGAPVGPGRRVARVLACPPATVLFGVGGFIGVAQLVSGGSWRLGRRQDGTAVTMTGRGRIVAIEGHAALARPPSAERSWLPSTASPLSVCRATPTTSVVVASCLGRCRRL